MVISDALARSGSDHPNPGKSSIGISTSKILEHPGTRISTFGHIFMQIFMHFPGPSENFSEKKMAKWQNGWVSRWSCPLCPAPGSRKLGSRDQVLGYQPIGDPLPYEVTLGCEHITTLQGKTWQKHGKTMAKSGNLAAKHHGISSGYCS